MGLLLGIELRRRQAAALKSHIAKIGLQAGNNPTKLVIVAGLPARGETILSMANSLIDGIERSASAGTAVPDEVLRFSESRLRAGIEARPIIALSSEGLAAPIPMSKPSAVSNVKTVDVIRIASASHFIPHANPRDENQTETLLLLLIKRQVKFLPNIWMLEATTHAHFSTSRRFTTLCTPRTSQAIFIACCRASKDRTMPLK